MNQALINARTYLVPGTFTELSPRQYVAVVGLLHAGLTKLELKLGLTLVLLDVAHRPLLYAQLHRMSDVQRHDLTVLADFLLDEPRFVEQLLPELKLPGKVLRRARTWYGPAAALGNLTFAEFIEAEGHFAAYQAKQEPEHLAALVATLYRPDRSRPYDPADVATRAEPAGRLPAEQQLAVRLWYASCRAAWARKYRDTLFEPADEQAPAGARRPDPRATWRRILAERAGSPLHYEEFGQLLLPNVFFDLDLRVQRQREGQEALKK